MYKSVCGQEWCRIKQGKLCHFIHLKNDQIFGYMLFKIKCKANDTFETQSNASIDEQKDEILFGSDIIEEQNENEHNKSPWKYVIKPYLEANDEEREAEIKELSKWRMESTNISIGIETVNKCNHAHEREYDLFIIYEDDKDADITLFRTFVNILFPCTYDVGLRTLPVDNTNGSKKKKKKQRSKLCPACYFNVCNENEHWQLENNRMVLVETDSGMYDDELQGVIVEQLESININTKRYKVRLEKYGGTDYDITCWLKLAIIASSKFNKKHRKHFDNVHISYLPSPQYQKIQDALEELGDNKIARTDISKIIFGIENKLPSDINDYNVTPALIRKLFPILNDSQIYAICGGLLTQMYTFQGPPATGKTSVCAHIAYLWWRLNGNSIRRIKIHGLVPTNKGCLVLAQKCIEMSKIKIDILTENQITQDASFKVLYFASNYYSYYLADICTDINDECKDIGIMNEICVNVMAENALRKLNGYRAMSKDERKAWKEKYMKKELKAADMIVTTFGNTKHPLIKQTKFTHAICDESNQASLETFLGIIRDDIKQLVM
eukprot:160883_1